MPEVSEHTGEVDGLTVFWRGAVDENAAAANVWRCRCTRRGVPDSSDEWVAPRVRHGRRPRWRRWWRGSPDDEWTTPPAYDRGFLEQAAAWRSTSPASAAPPGQRYLSFTIEEYDDFIERFLAHLGLERVRLVMHDWGAVGLAFAQRQPERVERLGDHPDAVPFLPGYRWHRMARMWRTTVLGELVMGTTSRFTLGVLFRRGNTARRTDAGRVERQRAGALRPGRPARDPAPLQRARRRSCSRRTASAWELTMPALIVWGGRDPYIPARFGRDYASALGDAELLELPDAGHWPWLDRPDVIERVVDFLSAG